MGSWMKKKFPCSKEINWLNKNPKVIFLWFSPVFLKIELEIFFKLNFSPKNYWVHKSFFSSITISLNFLKIDFVKNFHLKLKMQDFLNRLLFQPKIQISQILEKKRQKKLGKYIQNFSHFRSFLNVEFLSISQQ